MPKKKINYKQLAQEGRRDLFNIIAYYPTKRNVERLEKILNIKSRLKEISNNSYGGIRTFLRSFPKLSDLQYNEEIKIEDKYRKELEPLRRDRHRQCLVFYGKDGTKAYKEAKDVPGGASRSGYLKTPECVNHPYKEGMKRQQIEIDNYKKQFNNQILPTAILGEIYKKIFQYGTAYLKKVPIKFQRGQGAAWKSRHGPKNTLYGWYDLKKGVIHVRTHLQGKALPEDEIKETIIHELMHAYSHSLAIVVDKINKEYPVLKIKQTEGLDLESDKAHQNMIAGEETENKEYLYSASELYARGGSPRLRLYLNKLKGKKGRDLNDDINPEDIFTACKEAGNLILQFKDLGGLEFIWNSTACKSYKQEMRNNKTWKAEGKDTKLPVRQRLEALNKAHKQVLEKFKNDPAFREKFEKASRNINDLAKNLDQDPQEEPRAIAEYKQTIKGVLEEAQYKEIKDIFKRYL